MTVQSASGVEHSIALSVVAHNDLLLPMSCRALVHLQLMLDPKYLPTVADSALESCIDKVNTSHVHVETHL